MSNAVVNAVVVLLIVSIAMQTYARKERENRDASRLGFSPIAFGPHFWITMHLVALNLPWHYTADANDFEGYLYAVQKVLPCASCRDHFAVLLKQMPPRPYLKKGRAGAVWYMYTIHRIVTESVTGVPYQIPFLVNEKSMIASYAKHADAQAEVDKLRNACIQLKLPFEQ
jgi:hypothetical protein